LAPSPTTYVVAPAPASQFFVTPFDTGIYARDYVREHGQLPFGTLDDQLHLLKPPHFDTLRGDGAPSDYSIVHLLQRWYGGTPPVPML
jgi:hypothetical protein